MEFEKFKNNTLDKADEMLRSNAQKVVLKELKEQGINANDLSEEEFEQLFIEEYEKQKNVSKGVGAGAGVMLLLSMLG